MTSNKLRDLPAPFGSPDAEDNLINLSDMAHDEIQSQTANNSLHDVFGSAPTSPHLSGIDSTDDVATTARLSANDPSDIPRLRNTHVTNGYREGIAASKEHHLQQGFDQGYTIGAEIGLLAGWCLGALEGIVNAIPDSGVVITSCSESSKIRLPKVGSRLSRSEAESLLRSANADLDIRKLFGADYFGSDGLPLYEMCSQTAADVNGEQRRRRKVIKQPLIQMWTDVVEQLANALDLDLWLRSD